MSDLPKWITDIPCTSAKRDPVESERLIKALTIASDHMRWTAQTVHRAYHAYHMVHPGTWETCPKEICSSTVYELRRIEDLGK